jgi:hypothetical protein
MEAEIKSGQEMKDAGRANQEKTVTAIAMSSILAKLMEKKGVKRPLMSTNRCITSTAITNQGLKERRWGHYSLSIHKSRLH